MVFMNAGEAQVLGVKKTDLMSCMASVSSLTTMFKVHMCGVTHPRVTLPLRKQRVAYPSTAERGESH